MESFFPPFKDANYRASACQRAYFIRDANHVRSLLAYVLDARSYNSTAAAQLRMENSTGTVKSRFLNVEGKIRMKRKSLSGDTCKKKLQERRNQHFDEGHYFTSSYQGNLPARRVRCMEKMRRKTQTLNDPSKTEVVKIKHTKRNRTMKRVTRRTARVRGSDYLCVHNLGYLRNSFLHSNLTRYSWLALPSYSREMNSE